MIPATVPRKLPRSQVGIRSLTSARVILLRYLGLSQAPFWARGFGITLGVFCIGLMGLYLIPFTV